MMEYNNSVFLISFQEVRFLENYDSSGPGRSRSSVYANGINIRSHRSTF